jgi:hypothetical protein
MHSTACSIADKLKKGGGQDDSINTSEGLVFVLQLFQFTCRKVMVTMAMTLFGSRDHLITWGHLVAVHDQSDFLLK